jgi:hypothetical protein
LRNKALGELAFFCDFVLRADPESGERIQPILSFVSGVWSRRAYQDLIVRNPESLQLYALIYKSLLHNGFDVSESAETIQMVIDEGYATSVEAVPFRLMDLRNVLDGGRFRHTLPAMTELFERTMLARRPPLEYLTNADVYCITHAIFYRTDFGLDYSAVELHEEFAHLPQIVDRLLGLFVRLRDWDLTSELLICHRCLQSDPTIIQDAAWEALDRAQLPDGSIPAPGFDPNDADASQSPADHAFEQNYHTTIVAALAAAPE